MPTYRLMVAIPGRRAMDESRLIALAALYFTGFARIDEWVGEPDGSGGRHLACRLEGSVSDPFCDKAKRPTAPAREVRVRRMAAETGRYVLISVTNGDPATIALAHGLAEGIARTLKSTVTDSMGALA